ncbi:Amidase 1 [Platanthera zijinensis]|uniref:Amidase 1 n=1 Tax=Platanthera zijinensis TaxID=2320716 RepID=A0AAP0GCX2_9ASPA
MSEWDHFRSALPPQGWSPRGGQGKNPYPGTESPCGTSSGSAIAVAANLVTVSLGTDLDGAISCPASFNSVVGIKPTVGLTSRSGPMARTVADAVALLDVIAGIDPLDKGATEAAAKFIPNGGFQKHLNVEGLNGKRIGFLRHPFFDDFPPGSLEENTFAGHFGLMRQKGAIFIDNVELKNTNIMINQTESGEIITLLAEFKLSLNSYLKNLVSSPVRSLADVIAFNNQNPTEERMKEFGQIIFLASEETNGIGAAEKNAMSKMVQLCKEGIEDLMKEKSLDALIFSEGRAAHVMAIGGYPVISVPAGYSKSGSPFGISFAGLLGSDSTLIEIAYAFEQATKIRKSPPLG